MILVLWKKKGLHNRGNTWVSGLRVRVLCMEATQFSLFHLLWTDSGPVDSGQLSSVVTWLTSAVAWHFSLLIHSLVSWWVVARPRDYVTTLTGIYSTWKADSSCFQHVPGPNTSGSHYWACVTSLIHPISSLPGSSPFQTVIKIYNFLHFPPVSLLIAYATNSWTWCKRCFRMGGTLYCWHPIT